jgi:hypothetical protein
MANKKQAKVQEVNLNLPVLDYTGKKIGDVTLPSDLFAAKIKPYSVQRAVRVDLANRRVGTAHTLTRDIRVPSMLLSIAMAVLSSLRTVSRTSVSR